MHFEKNHVRLEVEEGVSSKIPRHLTRGREGMEKYPKSQHVMNGRTITVYVNAGEVLAWGMGSEGQLGTGTCSDAAEPAPALPAAFQGRLPLAVSAGGQHTVLLVVSTFFYSFSSFTFFLSHKMVDTLTLW